MTLKISISGVRGLVPESLTPAVCLDFARAFGTYLRGGKVAIGTDPRASSPEIKRTMIAGLLASGCRVIDLGIVPTPTVGIMVRKLKCRGGIVVTASHNPLPWNGLKFMRHDGIFLNEKQARRFLAIYESKKFRSAAGQGIVVIRSALSTHIRAVLKQVNRNLIRQQKLRVAVDACNGAGSVALPALLKKLGCTVLTINTDLQRPFPHPPEPTPDHLQELGRLVRAKKADLGLAMDSDADRLAIVSEQGLPVGEELTLALVVKFLVTRQRGKKPTVVINLSTTRAIEELGAQVIRTKVGEVNVSEEIKRRKALIGGEGNGGVIFPRVGYNRDALSGAALLLNYLAVSGQTLSQLVKQLPGYVMIKHKVECPNLSAAARIVARAKQAFRHQPQDLTEGVKVILPDGWVHIRASNTEPIVRLIAEARTQPLAEKLIQQAVA